jgi:hypothetical protein
MFKVGDKVVPIGKSVGCSLEFSDSWKAARALGQDFLYYNGISKHPEKHHIANHVLDDTGDYFLENDLILYGEEGSEDEGELILTFSIKELNDMVMNGILKETDQFIIRRA